MAGDEDDDGAWQDDPVKAVIRRNLKRFREEAGMTLGQAAEAVGLSQDYIHRIEKGGPPPKGRNVPDMVLMKKFLDVYGHTPDHVYMDDPPPGDFSATPFLGLKEFRPGLSPGLKQEAEDAIERINKKALAEARAKKAAGPKRK